MLEASGSHDHLCLIYNNREEQLAAAVPFIRAGLERGEKCLYVVDDNTAATVIDAMKATGIDTDKALASGALSVVTKRDSYLKNGEFDPDWMIGFLGEAVASAEREGYAGFRVTGEMTWALGGGTDAAKLLEYESKLNEFFPKFKVCAICQYNRQRFDPEILLKVIQTHPLIAHGELICDNPHYIPPHVFGREKQDASAELERLLNSVTEKARLKRELELESEGLRRHQEELNILQRVGATISSDLDLQKVVQAATDAGRELSGAEFGAFFYNVVDSKGESYMLYTLSGVPLEAFSKFPLPRNTAVFAPTFSGEGTVRMADVRADARYGHNEPYHGMPAGHLPVRSYLAVPVISRSGEVLGGLFYGHKEVGVFTERAERLVEGVAKQAAIAIDNARLYEKAQWEIEERRKAEKALKEATEESEKSRRLYNTILANTPDLAYVFDLSHRFIYANDALLKMWGKSLDEAMGKTCLELGYEPWHAELHNREIDQVAATRKPIRGEVPFTGTNGRRLYDYIMVPVLGPDGEVTAVAGTTRDVTERRNVDEALLLLAAIVESSDDVIVSKDLNGVVTSWNKSAERTFGYSAEEMIGKPILTIIPPELASDEDMILSKIRSGQKIEHFQTERVTKTGERLYVSVTISPIRDSKGTIIGAAKILRDITQQKRVEDALRRTEKLAATGRLAATMAHEINNPLESITNLLYLVRKDESLTARSRKNLELAEQELDRIAHVARQTLGFYRDTSTPSWLKVADVVNDIARVYNYKFTNRGIKLEKALDETATIHAAAGEFRQVFSNLLINAVDAIPGEGGKIGVRVRKIDHRSKGPGVRILIADSGSGISKANLSKLFEAFFTTKREVGTGLGLWLTRSIVEKHGGEIRVRSRVNKGTVFSVFWPSSVKQVQQRGRSDG